jgi:hypothetical protein
MTSTGDAAQYIADLEQEIAALKAKLAETEGERNTWRAGYGRLETQLSAERANQAKLEARLAKVVDRLRCALSYIHGSSLYADVERNIRAALAAAQDASPEPEARPGVPTELEQAQAALEYAQDRVRRARALA